MLASEIACATIDDVSAEGYVESGGGKVAWTLGRVPVKIGLMKASNSITKCEFNSYQQIFHTLDQFQLGGSVGENSYTEDTSYC